MLDSLKNNKKLLRRKSTFTILKEQRKVLENANLLKGKQLEDKGPLSPEIKAALKAAAHERIRKDRIRMVVSLFIAVFAVLVAAYVFIPSPSPKKPTFQEEQAYQEKREKFDFYINDGFMWLNKHHYKNALFQFKLAAEMSPKNIQARLGLTAAYAGSCLIDFEHCGEADREFIRFTHDFNDDKQNAWLYNYLITIGDTTRAEWLNERIK